MYEELAVNFAQGAEAYSRVGGQPPFIGQYKKFQTPSLKKRSDTPLTRR
jgi:hypothetical protein